MQSLKSRFTLLRQRLRRRPESLRHQGVASLDGASTLYDRTPGWWAKWTYTLVCADLIMTFVELTFSSPHSPKSPTNLVLLQAHRPANLPLTIGPNSKMLKYPHQKEAIKMPSQLKFKNT